MAVELGAKRSRAMSTLAGSAPPSPEPLAREHPMQRAKTGLGDGDELTLTRSMRLRKERRSSKGEGGQPLMTAQEGKGLSPNASPSTPPPRKLLPPTTTV